jgi:hypothetical protein
LGAFGVDWVEGAALEVGAALEAGAALARGAVLAGVATTGGVTAEGVAAAEAIAEPLVAAAGATCFTTAALAVCAVAWAGSLSVCPARIRSFAPISLASWSAATLTPCCRARLQSESPL